MTTAEERNPLKEKDAQDLLKLQLVLNLFLVSLVFNECANRHSHRPLLIFSVTVREQFAYRLNLYRISQSTGFTDELSDNIINRLPFIHQRISNIKKQPFQSTYIRHANSSL
ncbi:hypothetical protein MT997_10950 [Paenibacillus sp. OVF10]|nr:hypothetical protein MT997_10950 [Paenibacillus sp. OVF10]